jgi:hypothetical protein
MIAVVLGRSGGYMRPMSGYRRRDRSCIVGGLTRCGVEEVAELETDTSHCLTWACKVEAETVE